MKELFISEVHNTLPNTEEVDFANTLFKSDKCANENSVEIDKRFCFLHSKTMK